MFVLLSMMSLGNCISASAGYRHLTVDKVDLDRFMGKWYVIASIPTWFERHASNAVETYTQKEDGTIHVSFTYRHKTPSGKQKKMTQKAYVVDKKTSAHWKIRPLWPFLFDYLIIDLDTAQYEYTIIGRPNKENVWIMARKPQISEALYQDLVAKAVEAGYDASQIKKVTQEW